MTAILTLADGTKKTLALIPNGDALEIRDPNRGLPDNWGQAWKTGAPVLWDSLDVTLPDTHGPLGPDLRGFVQTGPNSWNLASPQSYHYHARRNGIDIYGAGVGQHHATLPGDTLYFRFPRKDDPWEVRAITGGNRAAALAVLDIDTDRMNRWPWLAKVVGWYRFDASSLNPATPAGSRNCGFLLNPHGFHQRWGVPLPPMLHWYGTPASKEAGAGLRNEHYNAVAAWIGSGLVRGDDVAVSVGLALLRQQIAYGLIWCDANNRHRGLFRTESGDDTRGTQTLVPSWAKGLFNKGLVAAAAMLPDDKFIQDAFTLHGDYLLTVGHEWNGAGGARNLGHYLEALWTYWKATGHAAYADRATQELIHAMPIVGGLPYFPENPGSPSVSGGEGLLALAYARKWVIEGGIMPQYRDKLDAMLDWTIANLWDSATGRWSYFATVSPTGVQKTWSGWAQYVTGPTLLDLPQDVRALSEQFVFSYYARTPDVDAAYGGEGPGGQKWWHMIATYGAWK